MFKQQLSPRSVHPYQTTVVPRSEQQFASASKQRAKYPWAEDINAPAYRMTGTDSSTSDNVYNVLPAPYNGHQHNFSGSRTPFKKKKNDFCIMLERPLRVIFVVGILTGISLCIAGIVLRRTNRNGDLGVLVYIGCLSSCVCGVLLGVQCCVRHEIRQRKLRANMHIPMQSIQESSAPSYPLRMSTLPHTQVYRPTVSLCPEEEVTGVPWWRRTRD
ncbi:hypothetical protein K1T71_007305 [Dendrolimus kikuchii]|uniref:Uncharacterized protein n=1 Tax=Dendrolimus kikuchii TaxID=765133 RepID=A0ACC1D0B9_9NEOP|nr:hypothetical protein K1T71_007305 [Dendrolimus kikuchii]